MLKPGVLPLFSGGEIRWGHQGQVWELEAGWAPGPGQSRSRVELGSPRRRPLALCLPQPEPDPGGNQRTTGIASTGPSKWARSRRSRHLEDMEERSAETNANVDNSASPSVAQLAGRFREQAAATKETPASKPTRRKPPCSLPLFPPKVELGQNGEEKSLPTTSHPPKIKVKSSPLIEKLQANLAFDPAALLPGASPKSPGLKAMVSPFHSPPSTPNSPGMRSRSSEPEEVPVSFDQPPEGSHLPCYNKVRTRGSIKRRPPSRRFRRSQSDCGDLGDFRAAESSQENGAKEENGDEVFAPKSKALGPLPSSDGVVGKEGRRSLGLDEKPPLRRTLSWTEKHEETASEEGKQQEKMEGQSPEEEHQGPDQREATEPSQVPSPKAENGCESPTEETMAEEEAETEKSTALKEEGARNEEDKSGQKSQDPEKPEQKAVGVESPSNPSGEMKDSNISEQEKDKEKEEEEGEVLETGCHPKTGPAQLETSSEALAERASPDGAEEQDLRQAAEI
ncbi:PREDICTED: capZ-interacting protein [Chrysochloris asiatica]|uniref:CapZ-interacting protein n=1 Tax=Chrysochloris asiatica TaxID=185453 RepID=A0A9B0TZ07_CHRAS|nr:PREDICTED: capZ-interacting protein [Chrysochloris asiatica]